jgi:hypothetical protein
MKAGIVERETINRKTGAAFETCGIEKTGDDWANASLGLRSYPISKDIRKTCRRRVGQSGADEYMFAGFRLNCNAAGVGWCGWGLKNPITETCAPDRLAAVAHASL